MAIEIEPAPGKRTGEKTHLSPVEKTIRESIEPGCDEIAGRVHRRHPAIAGEPRQSHAAACVSQRGIAAPSINPPLRLVEAVGETAQLGAKGPARPGYVADLAQGEKHMLFRSLPVDEVKLHSRSVETAGGKIFFRNRLAGKTACHFTRAGAEPGFAVIIAGRKTAGGQKGRAGEEKRLVMIGEADFGAILQRHFPAMASGRGIAFKMPGKGGSDRFHGRTSISGMAGIRPASKAVRLMSMRSVANRTGTSNS